MAVTEEQEEELHKKELAEEDDDVINVEGTKVKISKALVERLVSTLKTVIWVHCELKFQANSLNYVIRITVQYDGRVSS